MKDFNYTAEETQNQFSESKEHHLSIIEKIKKQLGVLKERAMSMKNDADLNTLNMIEKTIEKLAKQKYETDLEIAKLKKEIAKGE